MTDITKYRNVSLTHETYKTLINLSKVLLPDATLELQGPGVKKIIAHGTRNFDSKVLDD